MRDATDSRNIPLCIDLDGTLILTDLLWESLIALVRTKPLILFFLPFWLLKGKAYFKRQIAKHVSINMSHLPYRQELIDHIQQESSKGREIVLATASDAVLANAVAEHLGFFDKVLASNGELNLSGKNKSNELVKLYGDQGYEYAGNSKADMEVWLHAKCAIVINSSSGFIDQVRQITEVSLRMVDKKNIVSLIWRSARPHQWVKNILVFVPLLAAHQLDDPAMIFQSLLAFASFSLCASSAYFLNDLMDLESDRSHSKKCSRPLASGLLSIPAGIFAAVMLLAAASALAVTLPVEFQLVLLLYYLLTFLYSFTLKSRLLVDVFTLAALYTLRIFAGGVAIGVVLSQWLLAFSMFLFLSLAFIKRYAELSELPKDGKIEIRGRDYTASDMNHLATQGVVSGYLASIILALYVNSQEVLQSYSQHEILWFLPPLFLYWISRTWMITQRGKMHHDPIVFALRDGISYVILVMFAAVVWLAI
ncbi:MAG: UbiA family prenyltransferase [Mariprofundaceae bacterium]